MANINKINIDGVGYTIGQIFTGIKMVLVWTNTNTKVGVESLTVNVNLSPYNFIIVEYYWDNTANPPCILGNPSPVGKPGLLYALSADAYTVSRMYTTSTNQVIFQNGFMNRALNKDAAIPNKIYGITI